MIYKDLHKFIKAYIKSMRLYYAFITGIAGWIGVAFCRYLYPESVSLIKSVIILIILFLSWGLNQIINDYLGLKEDSINAPKRPMVTGELNIPASLFLSFVLVVFSAVITAYLSLWALIPLFGGILLNIIYEYAKGVPFLGNIVFGLMISMCTAYGYLALCPEIEVLFTSSRLSVLFMVALLNGLMTYYTYFKDYIGDRESGKVTAVVLQGIEKSRKTAVLGSFLPSIALLTLKGFGLIEASFNEVFIFLFIMTLFLQIWTGVLFYKFPKGKKAYFSLVTNFRACTCGQVMMIALFNKELALYLYIAAYIFIGFLFGLYSDNKM